MYIYIYIYISIRCTNNTTTVLYYVYYCHYVHVSVGVEVGFGGWVPYATVKRGSTESAAAYTASMFWGGVSYSYHIANICNTYTMYTSRRLYRYTYSL
jgi:fucose permease